MKELIKQYENNKKRSIEFMKNGQLNAYFEALLEMNRYKKLMLAVIANQWLARNTSKVKIACFHPDTNESFQSHNMEPKLQEF